MPPSVVQDSFPSTPGKVSFIVAVSSLDALICLFTPVRCSLLTMQYLVIISIVMLDHVTW